MPVKHDIVNEIIERADIIDIINEYTRLTQKGKNYMGLCPFHREKTPSFSVSREKQLYHCFGCGASGNVITFIEKIENVDFQGAIKILADRLGIDIQEEDRPHSKEIEILYRINSIAGRYFYKNLYLREGKNAYTYLKNRGLNNDDIRRFGIGYSLPRWDGLLKYLKSLGYDEEIIEKAGLAIKGTKGYYDRFRGRVIFPIFNEEGMVAGFGGRVLDDSKPKYLNSPETIIYNKSRTLYGLNIARKSKEKSLIIVEGYMDCIALQKYGFLNTVASLGTSLTLPQARLLKKYADEVYICYDSDIAGQEATLRGLKILDKLNVRIKIVSLPEGKDPDEFIKLRGKDDFSELIENAIYYKEYLIMRLAQRYNLEDLEQKSRFVNDALRVIADVEDEIEVDNYIKMISGLAKVSINAVRTQYDKFVNRRSEVFKPKMYINGNNRDNRYMNENFQKDIDRLENAYINAEKIIIYNILRNNDLEPDIYEKINPDIFEDEFIKKVYKIIYLLYKNQEDINEKRILSELTEDDLSRFLDLMKGEYPINIDIEKFIEDFLTYKKMRVLEEALRESKTKGDSKTVMELQKQLIRYRLSLAERGYVYVRK
ncbi:MAG: DNA primase [Thermoanaerobacteraceae bacterium]|nr:DNA primase [Thermoanaerobacteraceae bacterium]